MATGAPEQQLLPAQAEGQLDPDEEIAPTERASSLEQRVFPAAAPLPDRGRPAPPRDLAQDDAAASARHEREQLRATEDYAPVLRHRTRAGNARTTEACLFTCAAGTAVSSRLSAAAIPAGRA